jgi:6-phosphogluconolactonase
MRIRFLSAFAILATAAALLPTATSADEAKGTLSVYVGTYTRGSKSKGIYRITFDPKTGELSDPVVAGETVNPTFLALHPTGKFLYAVGEVEDFGKSKKRVGGVSAFAIDDKGDLTLLNAQSSGGGGPCHVITDKAGKNVLVANYGGGSCGVLPIDADGKLAKMSSFRQHEGRGVDKSRQEGPHAHSINLAPDEKFAFVADLGLDQIIYYRYDGKKGTITPTRQGARIPGRPGSVSTPAGGGPRHFTFHPNGKFAYTNNEMGSSVTAMTYDAEAGKLEPIQTITTLPKATKGNSTAEILVHPSGKFLYCSNRGHNSIAVFAIDPETGKLTAKGHQGEGINVPRNFVFAPGGKFCLVANQEGHSVIVFRVNAETGALEPTKTKVEVQAPVCLRFLK